MVKEIRQNGGSARGKVLRLESPEEWLISKVSALSGIPRDEIEITRPFRYYGLSSGDVVSIVRDLSVWLDEDLSSTLGFDYPNIQQLAEYLSDENTESASRQAASSGQYNSLSESAGSKYSFHNDIHEDLIGDSIAVVGMACRFPGGCNTPEEFWDFLKNRGDGISEVSPERWDMQKFFSNDPDAPGKMYTRWGGFINDIDKFDASFFGISPREARGMDVQQRLVLELSWEALENAGEISDSLVGSQTGVFIGISGSDYGRRLFEDPTRLDLYSGTGSSTSIAANRVSYALGLRGPSFAVDTACSSSLVSVHLACQSLLSGECSMALAGGVNMILSPEMTIIFSKANLMSPDGRCKTFDASANGYVRSEGCGMVVLKRLSDAVRDRNNILCVIRGTYVNQDGWSNGLTVPNGVAQQELLRGALAKACLKPAEVQYVETHGTGTVIGDPIEVRSLGEVMREGRTEDNPLMLGSVKTNIGHLEQAAGIAGLIKVILSLKNGEIPPHLHFKEINPQISLQHIPAVIPADGCPWPRGKQRRIAGVSGFSFGGVNAHVIVEEAPDVHRKENEIDRPCHIMSLSANSDKALKELAGRYIYFIGKNHDVRFGDMCFTANTGRAHLPYRLAVVAGLVEEAGKRLESFLAGEDKHGIATGRARSSGRPRVAFLFTGQGSQYVNMGKDLYYTQPVFRKALNQCDEILAGYMNRPLKSVLFAGSDNPSIVDQTQYTQPALFALEYALASLWISWGANPSAVMGHSVGEYVAACIAGVFSLEDGLKLIAARARLMQALPAGGSMAAVFAPEEKIIGVVEPYSGEVSIAALNGENTVISGVRESVEKILGDLEAEGIKSVPLAVSHAFHSPLMDPMLADFERIALEVDYHSPRIPLVSNVTGRMAEGGLVCGARYWCDHIRKPVRFSESIRSLHEEGYSLFLEVGPAPVLSGMGSRCIPGQNATWLPSMKRGQGDCETMLKSLAKLYVHGVPIDWNSFDADFVRHRMSLPVYPFERQSFWFEDGGGDTRPAGAAREKDKAPFHPSFGVRVHTPHKEVLYEYRCGVNSPFLDHHRVHGFAVLPGAAFISMVIARAGEWYPEGAFRITGVEIKEPLYVPEDSEALIQLMITPGEGAAMEFQYFSMTRDEEGEAVRWKEHAAGKIAVEENNVAVESRRQTPVEEIRSRCGEEIPGDHFYKSVYDSGLQLGPHFSWMETVWRGDGVALARIRAPLKGEEFPGKMIHPGIIDSGAQLIFALVPPGEGMTSCFWGMIHSLFISPPKAPYGVISGW